MLPGFRAKAAILGVVALSGCQASAGAQLSGNYAEGNADLTRDTSVDDLGTGSRSTSLGAMRLKPGVCEGFDLEPSFERLSVADLEAFLQSQGVAFERVRARADLHYLDVKLGGESARLRVATLGSAQEAARDLHQAVLQHGPGSWGTHRSNLAVLAPIASPGQIVGFASKTKLACWGVLTVAGRDDSFVVPGGYYEL